MIYNQATNTQLSHLSKSNDLGIYWAIPNDSSWLKFLLVILLITVCCIIFYVICFKKKKSCLLDYQVYYWATDKIMDI